MTVAAGMARTSGRRSWLAGEGPGDLAGDGDTGKHYHVRRNP
jgi:hypothetical protein